MRGWENCFGQGTTEPTYLQECAGCNSTITGAITSITMHMNSGVAQDIIGSMQVNSMSY